MSDTSESMRAELAAKYASMGDPLRVATTTTTPRLTDAELAELQEKAEKSQDASMEGRTFAESVHRDFMRAVFHQTANPATVLRLLDELKAARSVIAAAEAWRVGRDRNIVGTAPSGGQRSATGRALIDAIDAHRAGGGL